MGRKLIRVIHAVVPNETHFVLSGIDYIGILDYWIIAEVENDSEDGAWVDTFPIIAGGAMTLSEQIEDDNYTVRHWAEMRNNKTEYFDDRDRVIVRDLLEKLWSIPE